MSLRLHKRERHERQKFPTQQPLHSLSRSVSRAQSSEADGHRGRPYDGGLLLDATVGVTWPRVGRVETTGGSLSEEATVWVGVLQTARYALMQNNAPFLLMPSDRVAVQGSVGAHFLLTSPRELGFDVRLELHAAWFVLGGGFAFGTTTGFQPSISTGLRFGF